jgi:hypothetical protein
MSYQDIIIAVPMQVWHADVEWIAAVKEAADAEGVSQAKIVDRALRQYVEGR